MARSYVEMTELANQPLLFHLKKKKTFKIEQNDGVALKNVYINATYIVSKEYSDSNIIVITVTDPSNMKFRS